MDNRIIALCTEALAALAQAEAAMTPGPWTSTPDGERGFREFHSAEDNHTRSYVGNYRTSSLLCHYGASCPGGPFNGCAVFVHNADADGAAMLRNAAPGLLAGYRELLTLATGWLLPERTVRAMDRTLPKCGGDPDAVWGLCSHRHAEQIIATIARALAPCYAPLADAMREGQ